MATEHVAEMCNVRDQLFKIQVRGSEGETCVCRGMRLGRYHAELPRYRLSSARTLVPY